MISKIHPDLLNSVSTLSSKMVDCFLYANHYQTLENELIKGNIQYVAYPFMQSFHVKLPANKIVALNVDNKRKK